ncbi:serine hydrolase [Peristeroidobacter agariperforans]|uniref:serine hydrolase n=1 Tax=Peristeroidobacter agariperforans TaxID=268404 RepID=UPI001E4B5960|nr:serine hydrolase [Peristeroidobacter agariperforans]
MDQIVQHLVDRKQFMGTVLVARADQIVFHKSYGSANLEWDIANTSTTKYRIGSITKQFTSASILLLEERGKLKLDDPIKKHFGEAPAAWDSVTLEHLLTHTSGIPNFTSFPEFDKLKQFPTPVTELMGLFKDKPLEFAPGEKMAYSNSGYVLLGYVIEKASGMSYADFVQANIFTPLGMKDSGYDSNAPIIARRAAGYTRSGESMVNADFVHMSIPHAAGGLYSTTEDLLRWQRQLYGGKLLSAASLAKMTTPFKNDYALGLAVHTGKRKMYSHGGGIEGFNTLLAYYPDTQVSVVALANLNGNAPAEIAAKLGSLAHGDAVVLSHERKEITVPRRVLERYVGTYALSPQLNVMVTLEGDQLMTQVSGQQRVPTFAESQTRFFLKVVDAQWEFVETDGKVTHVILYQGGREIRAKRTSDTVAVKREIPLPVSALKKFVGTYQLRPGFDLVIKLEGEQLILHPTGQGTDRLYAETADTFFSKVVDATIQFHGNPQGEITHLTLNQGQFKGDAHRK